MYIPVLTTLSAIAILLNSELTLDSVNHYCASFKMKLLIQLNTNVGCDMFSMSPHAEQSGCQAVFHSGLKEFPWPSYAKKSADLSAEGDGAIWVRDCAAAAENILPGHDAVRIKGRRLYGVVQYNWILRRKLKCIMYIGNRI